MATTINASSTAGLVQTADTSAILQLQTAGTTAISIDASQAVTMAGRTSNPTTISVGAATPSTSGAGITFPATQSASSNANTLDDYEEGSWTPTMIASTSGTITLSSPTNSMRYRKIGDLITLTGVINISSVSSPVGDLRIGGIPVAIGQPSAGSILMYGFNNTSPMTAVSLAADTAVDTQLLVRGFLAGGQVTTVANNASAGGGVYIEVSYIVA